MIQILGTESPLAMMKNGFYFTLKISLFLRFLNFNLNFLVMQKSSLIRKLRLIFKNMTAETGELTIVIHILPNIQKEKSFNQTKKSGQFK